MLAVEPLREMLKIRANTEVPEFRVSCGFTGSRLGMRAIGVAWNKRVTADETAQVYVSPLIDESLRVLDILLHEMIHVAYPDAGHKGPFKRAAQACGLKGKMTATIASDGLKARLQKIVDKLGAYPHSKLQPPRRLKLPKGKPVVITDPSTGKQIEAGSNQLVKLIDPARESEVGMYSLWVEARFLTLAFPLSPWGHRMVLAETRKPKKTKIQ